MSSLVEVVTDQEITNWLKAWLALNTIKKGLEDFVDREVQHFQTSIFKSMASNVSLPSNSTCTSCLTVNLLTCSSNNGCKYKRNRKCKQHDTSNKQPRPCPNRICNAVFANIRTGHRYNSPSMKNTSAEQWSSNHWEVGKCYMPPDGYHGIKSVRETDFNGIISVVLNCKHFDNLFTFSIAPQQPNAPCLLTKARDIGKDVRHSATCKVTGKDLQNYIATLVALLSDSKVLLHERNAQNAVLKLNQLQNETFDIPVPEMCQLLKDAHTQLIKCQKVSNDIKTQIETYIETHRERFEKIDSRLERNENTTETMQRDIDVLNSGHSEHIEILYSRDDENKTSVKEIKRDIGGICYDLIEQNERIQNLDSRQNTTDMTLAQLQRNNGALQNREETNYDQRVEEFRSNVIQFYQEKKLHVPINPLMPSTDKELLKIYVPPRICKMEISHDGTRQKKGEIHKYKDIIYRDENVNRRIVLQGEAGKGKSTFVTKLVLDWCSETSSQIPLDSDKFIDVETLHEYRFLFHIELRDSIGQRDVETMIKDQIVNEIYDGEDRAIIHKLLSEVLKKEKCLVVEDGLDEWKDTEDKIALPLIVTTHKHCHALITTRPYKMTDQRIKDSQIDCLLEIEGLSNPYTLCEKLLHVLNIEDPKTVCTRFKEYVSRCKLESLLSTPICTNLIVWTWLENKDVTGSLCGVYTNLIDALLKKANNTTGYFQLPPVQCFETTAYTEPNIVQVDALSKMAFHQLFCHEKERSLVFSSREVSQYLSEDQKGFALKSGILSMKRNSKVTKLAPTCSFIHKSIQEFLAAFYVTRNNNVAEDHLQKYIILFPDNFLDVKQVFIFLCGMNIEEANELSVILDALTIKLFIESMQSVITAGYKEALANKISEKDIHLKLSNINYTFTKETELQILQMNKSNIISLHLDGTGIGVMEHILKGKIELNESVPKVDSLPVQELNEIILLSAHILEEIEIQIDVEYGEINLSPCQNIKSVKISGQVTLIPQTLQEFKCLERLSLFCTCNGLDLSTLNSLKQLELGGDEIRLIPQSLINLNRLQCLTLSCTYDGLDLSLCPNLEKLDLGETVTLLPNAFIGVLNIKSITLDGAFELLDLSSCKDLESVSLFGDVKIYPNTLSGNTNLKQIFMMYCPCESLDLSLSPYLTVVEIVGQVTLVPEAFTKLTQLKTLELQCECDELDLSSCKRLESIRLKGSVTLLPTALNGLDNLIYLTLDCRCSNLDLSTCTNLLKVDISGHVGLAPQAFNNLRELVILTLDCECDELDLSSCCKLTEIDLGEKVVLLPMALRQLNKLRSLTLYCKVERLDLSTCINLRTLECGDAVTLLPNTLSGLKYLTSVVHSAPTPTTTRSGRIVRVPSKYRDYKLDI